MSRREDLSSHAKPIEVDPSDLYIEGTSATNIYWSEFARRGDLCVIQSNRWMPVSGLICTAVVAGGFIAAGWAADRWMPNGREFIIYASLIGTMTVVVMLALFLGTHFVLRKRGPWLQADISESVLQSRLANQTWPLNEVDGLIVVEGELRITNTTWRLQEIKVVVAGKPYHAYSQAKNMTRSVPKVAYRFGEATGLPVQVVKLPPNPRKLGIEIG